MIIYLEGPDGSGKTTLANKLCNLCDKLNIDCMLAEPCIDTKPTSPNRVNGYTLLSELKEMLVDDDMVYILDRGPISDCIYRLFDNYEPVCELSNIIEIFKQHQNRLILIYCSTEEAEQYMKERGDNNPIALEKHHKISYAYDMIFSLLYLSGVYYICSDFVEDDTNYIEKLVEKMLKEIEI